MSIFENKSGCEVTYLAASFANVLSNKLTCDEIVLLSSFLVAVGDNLAIIANQCFQNLDKKN